MNQDTILVTLPVGQQTDNMLKIETYSIKRTLLVFAFIDIFFQLLSTIIFLTDNNTSTNSISYISLIFIFFIGVGAFGVKNYEYSLAIFYQTYLGVNIIITFIFFFYVKNIFSFILHLIMFIINIWTIKLLFSFSMHLDNLSPEDISDLQSGWMPNVEFATIYY